jgi:ABC-type multidrug transport system fused ATPase/permease subunit
MYRLLDLVLGQISGPELRAAIVREVADALREGVQRGPAARGGGETALSEAEISAALVKREESDPIGDQKALTRHSIRHAQELAEKIRAERLHQARMSFLVALSMSIAGIVVILAGLVPVLGGVVTAGVIIVVSGTVCEAVGLLAFRLNRQASDRLDAVNQDITLLTNTMLAAELVGGISDARLRDRALADAVRALRGSGRAR